MGAIYFRDRNGAACVLASPAWSALLSLLFSLLSFDKACQRSSRIPRLVFPSILHSMATGRVSKLPHHVLDPRTTED
jgi:hypothetical protein